MNRDGLIHAIADETDEPLGIVEQIVDAMLNTIIAEVNRGRSVNIAGFGNFYQRSAAAQAKPHPHTGERTLHPGYQQLVFRATGAWRSTINRGRENGAADEHGAIGARAREVG